MATKQGKQQNIAALFEKVKLKREEGKSDVPSEPPTSKCRLETTEEHKDISEKKTDQKLTSYVKVDLPASPYQPSDTTDIPPFVRTVRGAKVEVNFKSVWFQKWDWLHYVPHLSAVICFSCANAYEKKLIDLCKNSDPAFICKGFKNWTKGTVKFSGHEDSKTHKLSVMGLAQASQQPVSHMINSKLDEDYKVSIQWLKTLFTSVQYLARQCIAIRGHTLDSGNLHQLLLTRCRDSPSLMVWFNKKQNWNSPVHQNEILNMLSHSIVRQLVSEINKASVFSVIMDGTQDISGDEQESVCIRYVDENFVSHEVFVGFYKADGTTGLALSNILKDIFLRLGLPIKNLRFQTYDGAGNMTGKDNGCQAIIKQSQPLALYVHCGPHVTNLVAKYICNEIKEIRNALKHIQDLGKINMYYTHLI